MKYLLDTNICIFLFRNMFGIADKLNAIGNENCYISEITVAELKYGVECSSKQEENTRILNHFIQKVNIIPFEFAIDSFAKEKARLRKEGKRIDDFDLLIGCTAKSCGLKLVTDNLKHFQRIDGIEIENWTDRNI